MDADSGEPTAQFALASLYAEGVGDSYQGVIYEKGVRQDHVRAAEWYQKAADQGHARAQFMLGLAYETGRGVPRDPAISADWYRKSAEQGDAEAAFTLFNLLFERDVSQSIRWLRRAAESGHPDAQSNLGYLYRDGAWAEHGVPQDDAKAFEWYLRAAEQGHAECQLDLGRLYLVGDGVKRNEAEAVVWIQRAAEQGYSDAQKTLGDMYADGKVVTRDETLAADWLRRAAEPGHTRARTQLSEMQSNGKGLPADGPTPRPSSSQERLAPSIPSPADSARRTLVADGGGEAAASVVGAGVSSAVREGKSEEVRRLEAEWTGDAEALKRFAAADERAASPVKGFERGLSDGSPFCLSADLDAWQTAERRIAAKKEWTHDSTIWTYALFMYPFCYVGGWLMGVSVKGISKVISWASDQRR